MSNSMNRVFRYVALIAVLLLPFHSYASVGKWTDTPAGLPYYIYEGGESDPYFLLGNYRISLMTHANGEYELMSGERVWGSFNADPKRLGHGRNKAVVTIDDHETDLISFAGKQRNSDKFDVMSGLGFTRYDYKLDGGIRCTRTISVMPSEKVNEGHPCFLLSVSFRNIGDKAVRITYDESFSPAYVPMHERALPENERTVKYLMYTEVAFRYLKAMFAPVLQKFINYPASESRSRHEIAPQPVFLYSKDAFLIISEGELKAEFTDFKVKSGDTRTFHIVIGFADDTTKEVAEDMLSKIEKGNFGAYESLWKKKLPDFSSEKDRNQKRELYWNAHMLEASAVYDRFFNETYIPEGGAATYSEGRLQSNRSHLLASVMASYSSPELAKSSIKYVMRHSDFDGRIYPGNMGFGYVPASSCNEDDLQIRLFHSVAEYLRITGDYGFLDEEIRIHNGEYISVLRQLERCFVYLRDDVSGSPEADSWVREAALVAACMPEYITQLELSGKASEDYLKALKGYLSPVQELCLGADHLYCSEKISDEVRTILLHVPSIASSRKRDIYDYMLDNGWDDMTGRGYEETYYFISGVSTFDRLDAGSMLRKLAFSKSAEKNPESWIGKWTADGYSMHAHLWPLYCYYRQTE